jgi:hypothetical protein
VEEDKEAALPREVVQYVVEHMMGVSFWKTVLGGCWAR